VKQLQGKYGVIAQESKNMSIPFKNKLDALFVEDPIVSELNAMIDTPYAVALRRFKGVNDLSRHLSEGALLNINQIGSHALSIPCGEYMVMATDAGHTMLVPIELKTNYQEVFEGKITEFEIQTPNLLGNWHNVERVLAEESDPPGGGGFGGDGSGDDDDDDKTGGGFKSRVNPSDIDRNQMLRAMEQQGFTVTSLADAVGVDVPAISRLLRTPKDRQGDPGGRNPSIGMASKVANELRVDVEALFPDIFGGTQADLGPRKPPANRGSGKGGAGGAKAAAKWTQGGG
jgi:hypothetical protein